MPNHQMNMVRNVILGSRDYFSFFFFYEYFQCRFFYFIDEYVCYNFFQMFFCVKIIDKEILYSVHDFEVDWHDLTLDCIVRCHLHLLLCDLYCAFKMLKCFNEWNTNSFNFVVVNSKIKLRLLQIYLILTF